GFSDKHVRRLLNWARDKNDAIRGIVLEATEEKSDPECRKFFEEQLDTGLHEAIFRAYLSARHDECPQFKKKRLRAILKVIKSGPREDVRWALCLFATLAERDPKWRSAITASLKLIPDSEFRRVLKLSLPGATALARRKFSEKALQNPL